MAASSGRLDRLIADLRNDHREHSTYSPRRGINDSHVCASEMDSLPESMTFFTALRGCIADLTWWLCRRRSSRQNRRNPEAVAQVLSDLGVAVAVALFLAVCLWLMTPPEWQSFVALFLTVGVYVRLYIRFQRSPTGLVQRM